MKMRLTHLAGALGVAAMAGVLLSGSSHAGKSGDGYGQGNDGRPPQTLPQGYESTEQLQDDSNTANAPMYSVWLVESSRFINVPFGSFMPDRTFVSPTTPNHDIQFVDFPANVGIIKGADGNITLYDSGWKQLEYIFDWNTSCCWWNLPDQMRNIGLDPNAVTRIVLGHGHWDHAGQLDSFPDAVIYVQKEELKAIDFFTSYPTEFNDGHIRAVNTVNPTTGAQVGPPAQACARSPACGYPPQTLAQIEGKILASKARIVDGRYKVAPGLIIHPAFRGHTYGAQLLQVHTARGEMVFGSDTYSSWEGIRDWNVANIQQTDTVQQMLAYEKCYILTANSGGYNNCLAAHERLSYSADYPITSNWWTITDGNCTRAAELTLANNEPTHVPPDVTTGTTRITPPSLGGKSGPLRIDPTTCKDTIAAVPQHTVSP
jgi:glyoxylase-like metal-dependent hydrolase (beta-lactamase superfamily II)